jgi:hypothetical protein
LVRPKARTLVEQRDVCPYACAAPLGGLNDVRQLDGLLQALAFTQKRADSQIRWAALATTSLLRRHSAAHDALEAAMASGASVGTCIGVLEQHLNEEL